MNSRKKLFRYTLLLATIIGFAGIFDCSQLFLSETEAKEDLPELVKENFESPIVIQDNSILPVSPMPKQKVVRTIRVSTTAYSSTVWQTDDTPFITAAGTSVRDGIVANNLLPFGTKIRLPEIYGDKVFIVEDRMHSRKGYYHIDIWCDSYIEAKDYGAKRTYIEILEN
jgi:3D (Asp-Asp-Asp) domain-containing protein